MNEIKYFIRWSSQDTTDMITDINDNTRGATTAGAQHSVAVSVGLLRAQHVSWVRQRTRHSVSQCKLGPSSLLGHGWV